MEAESAITVASLDLLRSKVNAASKVIMGALVVESEGGELDADTERLCKTAALFLESQFKAELPKRPMTKEEWDKLVQATSKETKQ